MKRKVKILYDTVFHYRYPENEKSILGHALKISSDSQLHIDVIFSDGLVKDQTIFDFLRADPEFDFVVVHYGEPQGDCYGDACALAEKIRKVHPEREYVMVAESSGYPSNRKDAEKSFNHYTGMLSNLENFLNMLKDCNYLPKKFCLAGY